VLKIPLVFVVSWLLGKTASKGLSWVIISISESVNRQYGRLCFLVSDEKPENIAIILAQSAQSSPRRRSIRCLNFLFSFVFFSFCYIEQQRIHQLHNYAVIVSSHFYFKITKHRPDGDRGRTGLLFSEAMNYITFGTTLNYFLICWGVPLDLKTLRLIHMHLQSPQAQVPPWHAGSRKISLLCFGRLVFKNYLKMKSGFPFLRRPLVHMMSLPLEFPESQSLQTGRTFWKGSQSCFHFDVSLLMAFVVSMSGAAVPVLVLYTIIL
jgi:hypothetical protein